MYERFFGLREKPFKATPEPRFLYLTPAHKEALAAILLGIRERKGFVALIGEVGTGKTTLLKSAYNRIDPKTAAAYIFNTDLPARHIIAMILDELGLLKRGEDLSKVNALRRLNHFAIKQMAAGGNLVIMVDEAQNMTREAIENLRLLSNLESEERKLIQIIIAGQPELSVKLQQPESRPMVQRIILKRWLSSLDEAQTYKYMDHRLMLAGYAGDPIFGKKAQAAVWQYSQGVPRTINNICDNALLAAYSQDQKKVGAAIILDVARELDLEKANGSGNGHKRGFFQRFRKKDK